MKTPRKTLLIVLAVMLTALLFSASALARSPASCERVCHENQDLCLDACSEHAGQLMNQCQQYCREMLDDCLERCR